MAVCKKQSVLRNMNSFSIKPIFPFNFKVSFFFYLHDNVIQNRCVAVRAENCEIARNCLTVTLLMKHVRNFEQFSSLNSERKYICPQGIFMNWRLRVCQRGSNRSKNFFENHWIQLTQSLITTWGTTILITTFALRLIVADRQQRALLDMHYWPSCSKMSYSAQTDCSQTLRVRHQR